MLKKILFTALTIGAVSQAMSDNLNYNVISLNAQARQTVEQDVMEVVLLIQESGENRDKISSTVTERSNKVLAIIRANAALKSELLSRRAYPEYRSQSSKIQSWRDQAHIRVSSKNFTALSKTIASVQSDAAVERLDFSISNDLRESLREKLIKNAINNFKKEAKVITETLGGSHYQIVNLKVDDERNDYDEPVAMSAASVQTLARDDRPVMQASAGLRELKITVSGSIQVK